MPPAPSVASLGRFAEYPVDVRTGLPSISIPLWQIQENDLSMPIALSYHSSGVKVDEIAPWTGIGWNLITGGTITRVVQGIPDDYHTLEEGAREELDILYRGWLHPFSRLDSDELDPEDPNDLPLLSRGERLQFLPGLHYDVCEALFADDCSSSGSEAHNMAAIMKYLADREENIIDDTEPDIFYMSLAGRSVKFVLIGNQVRIFGLENVKIEPDYDDILNTGIGGFKVTLEDGTICYFDNPETSTIRDNQVYLDPDSDSFSRHTKERSYYSSWHLTKIISPNFNVMNFEYSEPITSSYSQKLFYSRYACRGTNDCLDNERPEDSWIRTTKVEKKYLEKILTKTSKIEFSIGLQSRLDLNGGRELGGVHLYTRNNEQLDWDHIKSYLLSYEYKQSSYCRTEAENCKRLFLTSVSECDDELNPRNCKPPYRFSYNETQLPPRGSFEQDHWGYFNDNNAESFIPELYVYPNEPIIYRIDQIPNYAGEEYYLEGVDRSVNGTKMQAGVLTKITYPTGGFAEFTYEPNSYYDEVLGQNVTGGGLRILQTKYHDDDGTSNDIIKTYSYTKPDQPTQSSGILTQLPQYARGVGVAPRPDRTPPWSGEDYFNYIMRNIEDHGGRDEWDLFTERYAYSQAALGNLQGGVISYTHVTVDHNGNGTELYEYHPPKSYLTHATQVKTTAIRHDGEDDCDLCDECGSNDQFDWETIQREGYNIFPFPPLSDDGNFEHGKLKKYTMKDEAGNPVLERTYTYETVSKFESYKSVKGLKFGQHMTTGITVNCPGPQSVAPYVYGIYEYHTEADALVKSIAEKRYDAVTSNFAITSIIHYDYQNGFKAPTTITTSYDQYTSYITKTTYPYNYADNQGGNYADIINSMLEQNRLFVPIESYTRKVVTGGSDQVISAQVNVYQLGAATGEENAPQILPLEVYKLDIDQPLDEASFNAFQLETNGDYTVDNHYKWYQSFEEYDGFGNIVQTRGIDDVPVSLFWGYAFTLPIAKAVNAEHNQIFYTSFEEEFGADTESKTGARSHLGSFTINPTNDSDLADGSYILSYWKKPDGSSADWEYVETTISYTGSYVINPGSGYLIDEVRIYPAGARFTTTSYDPHVGVISLTDERNQTSYYEYDELKRLELLKDLDANIIGKYTYRYKFNPLSP